jgi:hypothetical protein
MKTNTLAANGVNLPLILLGILAVGLVAVVLSGRKLPLIGSDRAALIVLVVIGMAMCSQGGLARVAASGAWTHPLAILGYLFGAAILLIGGAALFGKLIPPLTSFHQAFLVVASMAAVKVVIAAIHRLLV